jgi:protein-S-isoprenylcysteine O-methyltransferase Ste14
VLFFLDSILYVIFGFLSSQFSELALLDFSFLNVRVLEFAGGLVMMIGYSIFIWSVIARGRFATSWIMPRDHKLVDWGPYRYVRHPSYLGYFLMFLGFFFLWPNLLALIPIIAVPGYVLVTGQEESMLKKRFGDAYEQYARRVGRFLPRLRT